MAEGNQKVLRTLGLFFLIHITFRNVSWSFSCSKRVNSLSKNFFDVNDVEMWIFRNNS